MVRTLAAIFIFSLLPLAAQPAQFDRSIELIEGSMVAVPGLARIGAPLLGGIKKTVAQMKAEGPKPGTVYSYLIQLRGYSSVLEALPKTAPASQLEELAAIAGFTDDYLRRLLAETEAKLVNPDRDQLGYFAELNRTVMAPSPAKPRVVFLGDSIMSDWRLNEYFQTKDYINRAISGQITSQFLGRMRADVVQLKPAAVLVHGGLNDLGNGIAMETTQGNFQMIADMARANGIRVIFTSMLPIRRDWDSEVNKKIKAMNDWLRNFSKQRGLAFCDFHTAAVAADGRLRVELSDDGKHPNAAGYRQLAPAAQACILMATGGR